VPQVTSDYAGFWKLDRGSVPGLPTGAVVEIKSSSDGTRLLLFKPSVGQMASVGVLAAKQESSGVLHLQDPIGPVDIDLSRVEVVDSPDVFRLSGIALATAGLPAILEGALCLIEFDLERIAIMPDPLLATDQSVSLAYSDVALRIGGRGVLTSTTGGGWIGGGFGMEGILEGAGLAALMNALTTRTKRTVETFVELVAGPRGLILWHDLERPDQLRIHMTPILDRIATAQRSAAPHANPLDVRLAQLKQLGDLRNAGVLTDEEFRAEKTRILAS
jgi:hypothetical protein